MREQGGIRKRNTGTMNTWKGEKKKRTKEVKKTNCLNRKKKSAAEAVFLEFVSGINTQNYRFRKKLRRKKARMLNSSTNSNRAKKKKSYNLRQNLLREV